MHTLDACSARKNLRAQTRMQSSSVPPPAKHLPPLRSAIAVRHPLGLSTVLPAFTTSWSPSQPPAAVQPCCTACRDVELSIESLPLAAKFGLPCEERHSRVAYPTQGIPQAISRRVALREPGQWRTVRRQRHPPLLGRGPGKPRMRRWLVSSPHIRAVHMAILLSSRCTKILWRGMLLRTLLMVYGPRAGPRRPCRRQAAPRGRSLRTDASARGRL